ncbi:hypothetical protein GGI35DRAFT_440508 [Trichoderma velutinum]
MTQPRPQYLAPPCKSSTRHMGELSSRSLKPPNIANGITCMQGTDSLHARPMKHCRVRTWRPCVAGAVTRPLFTCPPQGEARDAFQRPRQRVLTAFLFCLLSYSVSCRWSLSASPWLAHHYITYL